MTEIYDFLNKHGFRPQDMVLDGKVHRFNYQGKKDGWYIGHKNHSEKTGEEFHVVEFGSWKSSEKYQYKTARKYTATEKKTFEKQIKKSQVEQKQLKKQCNLESSVEATTLLHQYGSDNTRSCYLKDKKIPDLFGCKTIMTNTGRGLLVPCKDLDGKLWGVQTIFPDGKKMFMPGQRVEGCFHALGDTNFADNDIIYLCEGFSTGTSILQAMGGTVVVCFNAGNLINVARSIKSKFGHLSIVICGDDDKWNQINDGRDKGEKAASEILGSIIFPTFKTEKNKPTDFNDLHLLEGLSAVKSQIAAAQVVKNYVIMLGHNKEFYYYTSSSNKQIVSITRSGHNKTALFDLMEMKYWDSMYPGKNGFDIDMAVDDLMKKCREKGVFNDSSVRGVGYWDECINLGDSLYVDGGRIPMHSIKTRKIYQIGKVIKPPIEEPLKLEECQQMLEALSILRWARPDSYKYLAGWLVVAPFCGLLKWRPHVWLTGPSGSGKSYVMENFVQKMMKDYVEFFESTTTEAGIRQAIGCNAKPIIFDEFETDDEKSANRIQFILELFRQASSESHGRVVKGTISGQAIQFFPRFAALVSSIRVNLVHEADKNRFTICELKRGSGQEQFEQLKKAMRPLNGDYYHRMVCRTYQNKEALISNVELFWSILADRYSQRFAQQYGTLLGGFALLEKEGACNKEEAETIIDMCDLSENSVEVEETDENECIDFLMGKVVKVELSSGHADRSVLEVLQHYRSRSDIQNVDLWTDSIIRLGIIPKDDFLYVCCRHPELEKIFKLTRWVGGWSKSMARIPNAENNIQKKILGKNIRCVKIPFSEILND